MIGIGLDVKYKFFVFIFKINANQFLECNLAYDINVNYPEIINNELYIREKKFWRYCVKYNQKNHSIKKL